MAAITLSVPRELKTKMDKTDWINWSSVARKAFTETLTDVAALEKIRIAQEVSEITDSDERQVKERVVREVMNSAEKARKKIASGKSKTFSPDEFREWCGSL